MALEIPANLNSIKFQKLASAADRWFDNICALKSWCNRKFNIEGPTFNKQFGIPEDMDYLAE